MRICLVSRECSPYTGGGIGTYVRNALRALRVAGHKVTLISDFLSEAAAERAESELRAEGVQVVRPHLLPADLCNCYYCPDHEYSDRVYRTLAALQGTQPFDVVEFPEYRAEGFTAIRAKRLLNEFADTKLIVKFHTPTALLVQINHQAYFGEETQYQIFMEDYAVQHADVLTSPSRSLAEWYRARLGLGEIPLTPYPLTLPVRPTAPARSGRERTVVYVGRLEWRKGVDLLLKAAGPVLRECPDVRLELVGADTPTGPFNTSMLTHLKRRCLPPDLVQRVVFHGGMAYAQAVEKIAGAAVCVFPSRWENWPNVCLEAMSLGVPVVASRNGGMAEMIEDDKSGYLVDPENVDAMAERIRQTLCHPEAARAVGQRAAERARELCDDRVCVQQMEQCYAHPSARSGAEASAQPFPKVSVIIPFYNQGAYLAECLNSVLASDYENIEVIVVNDGSTEAESVRAFERLEDARIRKLNKPNGGLSSARNAGLATATGEFVLPLDSDDRIDPAYIRVAVTALQRNPGLGYVTCYTRNFGAHENHYVPVGFVRDVLLIANPAGKCASLFRREVLQELNGYDEQMISFEDWDLLCRLATTPWDGDVLPRSYFFYRRHHDSMVYQDALPRQVPLMHYMISKNTPLLERHREALLKIAIQWWGKDQGKDTLKSPYVQFSIRWRSLLEASRALAGLGQTKAAVETLMKVIGSAEPGQHPGAMLEALVTCGCELARLDAKLSQQTLDAAEELAGKIGHPGLREKIQALRKKLNAAPVTQRPARNSATSSSGSPQALNELAKAVTSVLESSDPVPPSAVAETLDFIERLSKDADVHEFARQQADRLTPVFFALLGLPSAKVRSLLGGAWADRLTQVSAVLCPPLADADDGWSFCIITNGQRPHKLQRLLASVRALAIPRHEILIAGELAEVPAGVAFTPMVDAARHGRLGEMRNALVRQARFPGVVVSDDDMLFAPDFHRGLRRFGQGFSVMATRIHNPDGSRFWDWATVGGPRGAVLLDYWENDPGVYVTGGMCVLRKSVLDRVPWDARRGFYQGEDVDFSRRLQAAGIPIWYNPFCRVTHDDDRYTRIDRQVARWEHILASAAQRYEGHDLQTARMLVDAALRVAQGHEERMDELVSFAAQHGDDSWFRSRVSTAPNSRPVGASTLARVAVPAVTQIAWEGSFLDYGSLSHVNRELTRQLARQPHLRLTRVGNKAMADSLSATTELQALARELAPRLPSSAQVVVRHAWPPDWRRPKRGALVVIQPWEFGKLPETWVRQARDVDEFWVPSNYVRNVYVESGVPAQKVFVVPNGVDAERFHPQAAPMKLATQKKFKFLFVGGTIGRKGPDVLLKAYLESFTAADDVCLVIKDFGNQSFYAGQTFESQIRAAQSQPHAPEILYLNEELPPDSMPGIYTACDCLAHPYRGEGFGLPVLEAMACGLPVIVTDGGAADDFTGDGLAYRIPATRKSIGDSVGGMKLAGAGWLLEPEAPALAAQMKWIVEHPDDARATGHRASERVRREWTWERAARIIAGRLSQLPIREETETKANGQRAERAGASIVLPPCALVGHLGRARELLERKKPRDAWEATLAVLQTRPFHPEAHLLLAEIAQAAGDSATARLCAEHARHLAPGWKPARRFLNQRLKGKAQLDWLTQPNSLSNQPSPATHRLTVCLIAKNEEKFIGQCLASVRGLAEQIVVVDTGSTDRTVEIAREHGAEVHSFAWCDDFSAARNAALEYVRGDWVLMLDADEELTAEGREKMREEMCAGDVLAYRLPIMDVGREEEGGNYVPRLFRNAPGLFYVGRIHEQVFSSVEARRKQWGLENKLSTAVLIHHGYTAELVAEREKLSRNLRLLEQAIEEMPNEPNLLMNYGLELARAGRQDMAVERYLEAFRALEAIPEDRVAPEMREALLTQFSAQLVAAKRFDEVVRIMRTPLAQRGDVTASMHFGLGLSYMQLRRFEEAAEQFRQCLAKRNKPSLTPVNGDIRKAGPHHCLATCLTQMKQIDAADKEFQQALAADPQSKSVRLDYAAFRHGRGQSVDALKMLYQLTVEQTDSLPVWLLGGHIALSDPQFLGFAREWTTEAVKHFPQDQLVSLHRAEALLLSGQTGEALPLWRRAGAPTNPVHRAAQVLCELASGEKIATKVAPPEEAGVSREFIQWYQRLVGAGVTTALTQVNERIDSLKEVLPTAGKTLESALAVAAPVLSEL